MGTGIWEMPSWMEQYRYMINNTGGNTIERLFNDDGTNSNIINNAPLALICVSVKAQVNLLIRLHNSGNI